MTSIQSPGCSSRHVAAWTRLASIGNGVPFLTRNRRRSRWAARMPGARSRERTGGTERQVMTGRFGTVPVVTLVSLVLAHGDGRSAPAPEVPGNRCPSVAAPTLQPLDQHAPRASRPPATVRPTTPPKPAELPPTAALRHPLRLRSIRHPARDAKILDANAIWLRPIRARRCWSRGTRTARDQRVRLLGSPRRDASYLIGQGIGQPFDLSYGRGAPGLPAHGGCWEDAGALPREDAEADPGRSRTAGSALRQPGPRAVQPDAALV